MPKWLHTITSCLTGGRKVFKQTAPIIKLPGNATEDHYFALLGLLNSSTACFWLKQVCHQKQMVGGDGIRIESKAKVPYALNATQVGRLPLPSEWLSGNLRARLIELTHQIDRVRQVWACFNAKSIIEGGPITASAIRERWLQAQQRRKELRSQYILIQEEIDFTVYRMFNLVGDELLSDRTEWGNVLVSEGDRPFCIVDGKNEEGFPVPTDVPTAWPTDIVQLWVSRIRAIRENHDLHLIESSMYKRRWIGRQGLFNHLRTDDELADAAWDWLVNRLEVHFDLDGRMNGLSKTITQVDSALISTTRLADLVRQDTDFMQVGDLYSNDPAFDVARLVTDLIETESVPLLPALRYNDSGLRKRAEWEQTWVLQRQEDAIDARTKLPKDDPQYLSDIQAQVLKRHQIGDIPVPPKYTSSDFANSIYWRLRDKLDVPKERWISFPYCEGADGTLIITWAGYDHLQLARTISAYYVDIQERLGGRDDPRLVPLLACLIELLPWLKQWHNDVDPEFGMHMGDYFEGFIQEEAHQMGKTLDQIKAWEPPKTTARRRKQTTRS